MTTRKLWQRLRYRKQLKQGFGLLSESGAKKHFTVVGAKAFITNGVDPLVRVDLSSGYAEQYNDPAGNTFKFEYTYTKNKSGRTTTTKRGKEK